MIALIAMTTIFVFPVISVMLQLYVRNLLHLGPDKLGMLMGTSAVGALSGSIGLLSVARAHRFRFMTGAAVLAAIALFLLSRSNSFLITALCMSSRAAQTARDHAVARWIIQTTRSDDLE